MLATARARLPLSASFRNAAAGQLRLLPRLPGKQSQTEDDAGLTDFLSVSGRVPGIFTAGYDLFLLNSTTLMI